MDLEKILQFKFSGTGQPRDYELFDNGEGVFIGKWRLQDTQPTDKELQIIEASPEFQDWLENPPDTRNDREKLKDKSMKGFALSNPDKVVGIDLTKAVPKEK